MWNEEGLTEIAQRYLYAALFVAGIVLISVVMIGCDGDSGGTGGVFPTDEPEIWGPQGGPKVTVCHKGKTKDVPEKAATKHLDHGDIMGECPCVDDECDDSTLELPEEDHEYPGDMKFEKVLGGSNE